MEPLICPCGTRNLPEALYCSRCGRMLHAAPVPRQADTGSFQKAAILCLIGTVNYLLGPDLNTAVAYLCWAGGLIWLIVALFRSR